MTGRVCLVLVLALGALVSNGGGPARADVGLAIYGDIDYVVQQQDETTNSFMVPRLEVFYTATQDRLSFLAEVMMEVGENNEFALDVERVEVSYIFADWLRLHFGRFHTALGYYNDAYHHGRYFQMTVDRPEIVRFEDEGGLFPAHSVGLHVDGRFHIGRAGAIRYDVDFANGRGQIPDEVTNLFDRNNAKAINLRLRYEPAFLDGLILGGNIYIDRITAVSGDPLMPTITPVDERIIGAHLVYLEHNVHVIGEYMNVAHTVAGATGFTNAGFGELGYTVHDATPYFRYEQVSFPAVLDPYFAQNVLGPRGSFYSLTAGARYTVSDYLALKLEGGQINPTNGTRIRNLAVQAAFAF